VTQELSKLKEQESIILKLNKAISNLENQVVQTQNKYGTLAQNDHLTTAQTEIDKLKNSLKNIDNLSVKGVDDSINKATNSVKKFNTETRNNGLHLMNQDAKSLSGYLSGAFSKFAMWFGVGNVIMGVTNQLKEGVGYITSWDKALTNIEMITG
jgi:hypothetical protein